MKNKNIDVLVENVTKLKRLGFMSVVVDVKVLSDVVDEIEQLKATISRLKSSKIDVFA